MVLTKECITKYNIDNKISIVSKTYSESPNYSGVFSTKECITSQIVRLPSSGWKKDTSGYCELWSLAEKLQKKIKKLHTIDKKTNTIHMPPDAQDFFDLMRLDITRYILTYQDFTPFISRIVQDDNFDDPTSVQHLYEYGAPFLPFSGKGDKVRLIYTRTGAKDVVNFYFWGIGWESDLYNAIFNKIFDVQRINRAIARGFVARKNDRVINPIINFNYPATKIVTAYTAGASVEDNYYTTFQNAIEKNGLLYDPQTGIEINTLDGVNVICHPTKARIINRTLGGRLQNGSDVRNLEAISEIRRVIPYRGDRIPYGNETVTFEGCPKDEAFMFPVDSPYWYLLKRNLASQSWQGEPMSFASERQASYFVDSIYNDEFLGGADGSGGGGGPDDPEEQGFCVKINLPSNIAS